MIHLINGRNNYLLTSEFSKLSRSERSSFEKVRYHLKLNPALVISNDLPIKNQQDDLTIKENRVQFTKSLINQKSINYIGLAVYRKGSKVEPETHTISFKNLSFGKPSDVHSFQIKQQGAFYCSLNEDD